MFWSYPLTVLQVSYSSMSICLSKFKKFPFIFFENIFYLKYFINSFRFKFLIRFDHIHTSPNSFKTHSLSPTHKTLFLLSFKPSKPICDAQLFFDVCSSAGVCSIYVGSHSQKNLFPLLLAGNSCQSLYDMESMISMTPGDIIRSTILASFMST